MYGVLEVKGIAPFVLLTQFIEKQVFIMSSYILNFNRYSSSHSVIPLTIFTVILPNISSDLDLVVSSGRGLSFHVEILSAFLSILFLATRFIVLFFLGLTFFQVLGKIFFLL